MDIKRVAVMTSGYDRLLATRMGVRVVAALLAGEQGVMIGPHGREMGSVLLEEVCARGRQADLAYYEMAKLVS